MSIEDPISYSDWYWKHNVEAQRLRSEQAEMTYAPVLQQILDDTGLSEFMPEALRPLYAHLTNPESPDWNEIQTPILALYNRAVGILAGEEIARPTQYLLRAAHPTLKIDANMAAILRQRRLMPEHLYDLYTGFTGYDKAEADQFYKSSLPYPSIPDIITATRYFSGDFDAKSHAMRYFDIPEEDYKIWDWLSYQKFTTEQIQELHRRGRFSEGDTDRELVRLGWQPSDAISLRNLAYETPNAMLLAQSNLLHGMSNDITINSISKAGIHPDYAYEYLDAIMTKPATEDVIAYELRRDPSLSGLSTELKKIGVHEFYHGLYKELAYQIPPVADIITMAVREAFTPAIAARFGQYEDLPSEYVEAVGKKGLSREWAERYWAAHWSLPSPQQGFEMLHRGVIGEGDLNMLMRALDIMPFWRDKLIQIAYRPLSRVDVRRMFALGVLDVSGVRRAYTDIGYNDYNANLMTEFTIKYTEGIKERAEAAKTKVEEKAEEVKEKAAQKEEEAKRKALIPKIAEWTTAQTLKFLTMKLINEERARLEFELLGYNEERINVYIASVTPAP